MSSPPVGTARGAKLIRRSALAALLSGLILAGCGEVHLSYGDYHCHDDRAGIVVEFFGRDSGNAVAVDATGTLRDGAFVEQMRPTGHRFAGNGRTYALAGGFDREGVYDVRIETSLGEILEWHRIRVARDWCGPFTVVLQAEVRGFD